MPGPFPPGSPLSHDTTPLPTPLPTYDAIDRPELFRKSQRACMYRSKAGAWEYLRVIIRRGDGNGSRLYNTRI